MSGEVVVLIVVMTCIVAFDFFNMYVMIAGIWKDLPSAVPPLVTLAPVLLIVCPVVNVAISSAAAFKLAGWYLLYHLSCYLLIPGAIYGAYRLLRRSA